MNFMAFSIASYSGGLAAASETPRGLDVDWGLGISPVESPTDFL